MDPAGPGGEDRCVPGNLARRFTTLVGRPPMTCLRERRLALAANLLHQPDATLAVVTDRVGFANALPSEPRSKGDTASVRAGTGCARRGRQPDVRLGEEMERNRDFDSQQTSNPARLTKVRENLFDGTSAERLLEATAEPRFRPWAHW